MSASTTATGNTPVSEAWEYMYHTVKMGEFKTEIHTMNVAGSEGWELVNGLPIAGSGGTGSVLLLFKRRIRS